MRDGGGSGSCGRRARQQPAVQTPLPSKGIVRPLGGRCTGTGVAFTKVSVLVPALSLPPLVAGSAACEPFTERDFTQAQKVLRILSGLHGVLRPLDLIQPYRLEMGTQLKTKQGKDLYAFWGHKLTDAVNEAIKSSHSKLFVNLASNEYSGAVDFSHIKVPVITPVFKDEKNGKFKVISFFAKKARGMMANYVIRNRVQHADGLKRFAVAGYAFDPGLSDDTTFTYLRRQQ